MAGKQALPRSLLLNSFCPRCPPPLRTRITQKTSSKTPIRYSSSSSSPPQAVVSFAAPEIDFSKLPPPKLENARIVPDSPSYFSGQPGFIDNMIRLQDLLRKTEHLPALTPAAAPRVTWKTLPQFRMEVGEAVAPSRYARMLRILQRLNLIHPSLRPREVTRTIQKFRRAIEPLDSKPNPILLDAEGRAAAVGRRKTSSCKVWLVEGDGEVLVNGRKLSEYFPRVHDRESAVWALKATARMDKYNIWAVVTGGGTTGQAESMTMAVAKALLAHEPALKPALRRAGCITRDPRKVERKKPGHLKARKMPAWVRR